MSRSKGPRYVTIKSCMMDSHGEIARVVIGSSQLTDFGSDMAEVGPVVGCHMAPNFKVGRDMIQQNEDGNRFGHVSRL